MVRTWIKQNPRITAQFLLIEDNVYVEFFTTDVEILFDKERKLGQMHLRPADQVRLIQSFLSAKPEIL